MQLGSMTFSGGMTLSPPPSASPGSILFDNSSTGYDEYGLFPDSADLDMSTESFTVEWWVNYTSLTGYQTPWSKGYGQNGDLAVQTGSGTGLIGVILMNQGAVGGSESGSTSTGTWYHYALVRNGTTVNLYRDGTSVINGTSNADLTNAGGFAIGYAVGSTGSTGPGVRGYISCLRVVKGTAVYTGNFSKPTSPPTAISGTSLLLLSTSSGTAWTDSSGTGKTATVTGGTWSSSNPFS